MRKMRIVLGREEANFIRGFKGVPPNCVVRAILRALRNFPVDTSRVKCEQELCDRIGHCIRKGQVGDRTEKRTAKRRGR